MKKYIVDAFARQIYEGNAAGVVLLDEETELTDTDMQELAAAYGFSETAFIYPFTSDTVRIRYFTPVCEVPLCGHATIASFVLLTEKMMLDSSVCRLLTRDETLHVTIQDGIIWMEMGTPRIEKTLDPMICSRLCDAYHIKPEDLHASLVPQIVQAGISDIQFPVKNKNVLMRAKQDPETVLRITRELGGVGVHMFCLEEKKDSEITAYCSNFGPFFGIDEECATGTANAGLTWYLLQHGIIKSEDTCLFLQGEHMGRQSQIRSRILTKENNQLVLIGGSGCVR